MIDTEEQKENTQAEKFDTQANELDTKAKELDTNKIQDFHRNRIMFAWIDSELVINATSGESRKHREWLKEDYEVTEQEFNGLHMGYINSDRIQLFMGSDFKPIPLEEYCHVLPADINKLVDTFKQVFKKKDVNIYNGLEVGRPGEVWKPLSLVGYYKIKY